MMSAIQIGMPALCQEACKSRILRNMHAGRRSLQAARGWEADYPLFTTVNRIMNGQLPPSAIVNYKSACCLPPSPLPEIGTAAGSGALVRT